MVKRKVSCTCCVYCVCGCIINAVTPDNKWNLDVTLWEFSFTIFISKDAERVDVLRASGRSAGLAAWRDTSCRDICRFYYLQSESSYPKACWLIARRLQITIEDLAASERKGGEREDEGPHKIRPSTTMSNKRLSNVWKWLERWNVCNFIFEIEDLYLVTWKKNLRVVTD